MLAASYDADQGFDRDKVDQSHDLIQQNGVKKSSTPKVPSKLRHTLPKLSTTYMI